MRHAYTCTELTGHAKTNCEVIERFPPVRFTTEAGEHEQKVWLLPRDVLV